MKKNGLCFTCVNIVRKFSINLQFVISMQQMQHEKHPIKAKNPKKTLISGNAGDEKNLHPSLL